MKNKIAGFLVIGVAVLMGFMIYSYNSSLLSLATEACPVTGPACAHEQIAREQIKINVAILVFVVFIGLYLILFSKEERVVTKLLKVKEQLGSKNISKQNYKKVLLGLHGDEKKLFESVIEAKGSIYQSVLVEKTGFSKVHVTRILDSLEGKDLIERKRRGMTNIIVLTHRN